jgi:uncharacterized protein
MKFQLDTARSPFTVASHHPDHIVVGGQRYYEPLVLTPDGIETDELPRRFADLRLEHLARLAERGAEIILIGSGPRQIFLDPALVRALAERGVGVESMTTPAACRCYNVLTAEQRAVAAVLFIAGGT